MSLLFGAAIFFDLFWPERKEARCIQWTWKLSAAAASVFQLAACLATTVIVATHRVQMDGVSVEQQNSIRRNWNEAPLVYRHEARAVATVVTAWIVWLSTFWRYVLSPPFLFWLSYVAGRSLLSIINAQRERKLTVLQVLLSCGDAMRTTTSTVPFPITDSRVQVRTAQG